MTATVKTKKGIHKMTLDRWGDSTHRMSAYNNRHKPSFKDQRQIERMDAEDMVLYPTPVPNPVLPRRAPGFSGGRGVFSQDNRTLNWRAESLRAPLPRNAVNCLLPECEECPPTPAAYYRQQRKTTPLVTRRKFNRKSPSRRPHRRVPYYPPSPQYKPFSSSEDESEPTIRRRGKAKTPAPTPRPRDSDEDLAEENQGFSTPPEGVEKSGTTQQLHTALCQGLDRALDEAIGPQGEELTMGTESPEEPQPSTSTGKKQGGGDREPNTPGQEVPRRVSFATENCFMEPNKVKYMDQPDTYFANVGRHRNQEKRLYRARTVPHLVFVDPPASPDKQDRGDSQQQRAASSPPGETSRATPDTTTPTQDPPSLEMPEAPPVPLEPQVVVVPFPGAPIPQDDTSDCEIIEDPTRVPFKPKRGGLRGRWSRVRRP